MSATCGSLRTLSRCLPVTKGTNTNTTCSRKARGKTRDITEKRAGFPVPGSVPHLVFLFCFPKSVVLDPNHLTPAVGSPVYHRTMPTVSPRLLPSLCYWPPGSKLSFSPSIQYCFGPPKRYSRDRLLTQVCSGIKVRIKKKNCDNDRVR
jgi:hypothetical protein